jgi:hypothetical protein
VILTILVVVPVNEAAQRTVVMISIKSLIVNAKELRQTAKPRIVPVPEASDCPIVDEGHECDRSENDDHGAFRELHTESTFSILIDAYVGY